MREVQNAGGRRFTERNRRLPELLGGSHKRLAVLDDQTLNLRMIF